MPNNENSPAAKNENLMTTSTGSFKFDVVLEPAKCNAEDVLSPRIAVQSPTMKLSLEEIQSRLKNAADRRVSVEAEKVGKAKNVEQKIVDAAQRRQSLTEEFKRQLEVSSKKLETSKENRKRLINERVEKMKEIEKHVDDVRKAKMGGANGNSNGKSE